MDIDNNTINFIRNAINDYNGPQTIQVELNGRMINLPVLRFKPTLNTVETEYWSTIIHPMEPDSLICVKMSLGCYKIFWYKSNTGVVFQIWTNYQVNQVNDIELAQYNPNV